MPRGCTLRQLKERPGWRWHGKVAPEILPPDLETNAKYINEVRGLCNWVPSWSLTRKGPVKFHQNHPKPNRIVFQPMFQGRAVKLLGVDCKLDLPPHPGCHREKWRFREGDSPFPEHVRKSWGRRLSHPGWDQVDPNLKRWSQRFSGDLWGWLQLFWGNMSSECSSNESWSFELRYWMLRCWCSMDYLTSCHLVFGVSQMCQWCPFLGMCWSILLRLGEQLRIGNVEDWKLDLPERFQP